MVEGLLVLALKAPYFELVGALDVPMSFKLTFSLSSRFRLAGIFFLDLVIVVRAGYEKVVMRRQEPPAFIWIVDMVIK